MSEISEKVIYSFKSQLEQHPVYAAVDSIEHLQTFMEHHVYSVWDFMSLIKYLQNAVAPATYPWVPRGDGDVRRFINELVLEEESDEAGPGSEGRFSSHFELYCGAMREIGADDRKVLEFVDTVKTAGIGQALTTVSIPEPSRQFSSTTFSFIQGDKPHEVAAALALGREHIIPCMFRSLLKNLGVDETQAPIFHFYLNRHIHLDEDFHAPLSLRLLNGLCEGDRQKQQEAIAVAEQAVSARIAFWDGVLAAIETGVASGTR